MAGSSRYTAILDANVLYPQLLRDTLLSLAVARLYHARWTATIHGEWTRNLLLTRPDLATKLPAVVALMNSSVPDCLVTNYEKLAESLELPDPDEFVVNQLQLQKIPALSAIKKMRARWTNPARPAQELITAFELRGMPMTADLLREAITLI